MPAKKGTTPKTTPTPPRRSPRTPRATGSILTGSTTDVKKVTARKKVTKVPKIPRKAVRKPTKPTPTKDKVLPGDVAVGIVRPTKDALASAGGQDSAKGLPVSSPAESVTATADPKSGGLTKVTLEPTAADLAPKAVKTLTLDANTLTDAPPSATATPERQQSDVEVTAGDSQPAGQHSAGEDSDTKLEPRPSPLITQLRTELDKALGEGPEAHDASLTNPTLSTSGILEAEEDGFY